MQPQVRPGSIISERFYSICHHGMNLPKILHYTYHTESQKNLDMILCRELGEEKEKKMNELKFLIQKESSYVQIAYYTFKSHQLSMTSPCFPVSLLSISLDLLSVLHVLMEQVCCLLFIAIVIVSVVLSLLLLLIGINSPAK